MELVPIEKSVDRLVGKIIKVKKYASEAKNKAIANPTSDGVTLDESAAIRLYTMQWSKEDGDSVYKAMNYDLENKDREALKPWFPYLRLLLTGLLKLPPIRGHLFRGVKLALHVNYREGETATWWRFSSCTKEIEVLNHESFFGRSGERTLFDITCSEGRSIKAYSNYDIEEEVLLLPGTLFKIKGVANIATGVHMIALEETDTAVYLPARRLLKSSRIPTPVPKPAPTPQTEPPTTTPYPSCEPKPRPATQPRSADGRRKLEQRIVTDCQPRGTAELGRLELTDAEMPEIVKEVIVGKECTKLVLSDNNIRAGGLVALAKGARESQTLIELNLARNHLTDDDVRALAEELTMNETVEEEPSGCPCLWTSKKVSGNLHSILSFEIFFLDTGGDGWSFASAQSR